MKIAGLDIGTTGCKCTVFDEKGAYLGRAYQDYPAARSKSGHEIDVSVIMESVYTVLYQMADRYPDIAGVGVTSFGETFVMTDEIGIPLHKAMLYTDPRGNAECRELEDQFGSREIAGITGLHPHEMYSISKMMWLKKQQPELYEQASYIFLLEDFVVWHLTGTRQIDYSLASRTMAFDIRRLVWSEEIFAAAGIDRSKMSRPVPTGTDAGKIRPEVSRRTKLNLMTHIITVSHDQVAAAVGAGIYDADIAVDGAGTVECITPVFDELPDVDTMYDGFFSIVPYVVPGKYVAYAFSYTGGALIQWCTDTLAKKEQELAKEAGKTVNLYLEEACQNKKGNEPTGLLVLPHFAGAATPYMDTGSKGAVLGMTTDTDVADIYRACMEGVVYEMRVNAEALAGTGYSLKKMHATGGGAQSENWLQMKANILDIPIIALKTADAGTVGCAMMTGIAIGMFRDLEDAAAHMVEETASFYPDKEMHKKYMRVYERYKKVYQAVRPLMNDSEKE